MEISSKDQRPEGCDALRPWKVTRLREEVPVVVYRPPPPFGTATRAPESPPPDPPPEDPELDDPLE